MKTIALAIGAGLASALLYLAVTAGTLLAIPLFYLAPLPIMIAGLGWGTASGWIAAFVGSLTVAFAGLSWGAVYALVIALPAAFLARLAMLGRPIVAGDPNSPTEWYPAGRMLLWCAAYGAAFSLVLMTFVGFDTEQLAASFKAMMADAQQSGEPLPMPSGTDMDAVAQTMVTLLPRAFALIWITAVVLNLWLAVRITAASARLRRAGSLFADLRIPREGALALVIGIPLSFFGGGMGLAGTIVTAAFASIFAFGGIVAIHRVTRGRTWRPIALGALYAALLVFTFWVIMPLAIIGVVDSIAPIGGSRGVPRAANSNQSDSNQGD
ncbi:MAG: DUF2232 domain-containing protein [Rhodobiaceae bacterium]|nr:DUF2232 domain-containing protein [Rhodobiaceae bacterium]MCC0056515.1 DUF2232 domain-containing protein [Rhodobiaceae bacterium]